ncbi:MAG: putative serine/threonine-protein kinase iks1 [Peltula sp. TS41687]|nr:MAG: putative serine/threonine-protein kinase iks1 [Peltula sp. TS41687]
MSGHELTGDDRSLVPYSSRDNNEIVLRHNNALVVRDPKHKQLVLRRASTSAALELADCPYCRRPLHDAGRHHIPAGISPADVEAGFVDPNYFRMLRDAPSPASLLNGDHEGFVASSAPEAEFVSAVVPPSSPSPQGISSAAFSPDYFTRFFVEEGELGRGGKGVVLLVKHMLDGVFLGHFACKRVPVGDDHEWLEKVLVEVQLLQHLSHQNLVSYRHVWLEDVQLTKFGPSVPCAFILQQYCNGGDLHRYVCRPSSKSSTTMAEQLKDQIRRRSKGQLDSPDRLHGPRRLSFEVIYSFFKDITSGLKYLHDNGYIHRDLKPSNCLLHDTGKGVRVLVSDFGEAQMESAARKSTGATGTISYCAPEVLRPQYPGGPLGEFTARSDIFSLGMILYFMCFGRLPYDNADNLDEENEDLERLKDEISTWPGFDDQTRERTDLPDKLYKFLKKLLSLDPVERPTAEEILWGISTGSGLSDNTFAVPHNSAQGNVPTAATALGNPSRLSPINTPPPASRGAGGIGRRMMSPSSGSGAGTGSTRPTGPLASSSSSTSTITTTANLNLNHLHNHTIASNSNQQENPSPRQRRTRTSRRRSPTHDPSPSPRSHSHSLRADETASASENESPTTTDHLLPAPAPLLLAPPPRPRPAKATTTGRPTIAIRYPSTLIKTLLFLLKILSITIPCSPMAPNGWFFYPLLYLAALDFLLFPKAGITTLTTGGLLAVHFLVWTAASWTGGLCHAA